jgi:hypothetical protein
VRSEQSLRGGSPASERGSGTGDSGGERGRARESVQLSHSGRVSERVMSGEKVVARVCCRGAGRAGAIDVHAEDGAGAWRPWGARRLSRSGTTRAGGRGGARLGRGSRPG